MIGIDELFDWTKAEPEEGDNLRALERSAVEYINEPGGRYFGLTAERTEILVWHGEGIVQLADEPLTPETGPELVLEEWTGTAWQAFAADQFFRVGRLLYLTETRMPLSRTSPVRLRATYDAGFDPSETDPDVWDGVPEDIRQAIRMLVSDWLEHPEGERATSADVAVSVHNILAKYR